MAGQATGYDLLEDIRTRAERLRTEQVERTVAGLIRANQIQAGSIILGGLAGNVQVDGDALEVGAPGSLIDVPPGALAIGAEVLVPTGAITNTMLDSNSVTTSKIAANAIGANQIAANAVTTGKLAADAVTAEKLDVGTLSAITADLGAVTAGDIRGVEFRSGNSDPRIVITNDDLVVRDGDGDRAMHIDWTLQVSGAKVDFGYRRSWDLIDGFPGITFTDLGQSPDRMFAWLDAYWEDDVSPNRYIVRVKNDDGSGVQASGGVGTSAWNGTGSAAYNWCIDDNGNMVADDFVPWSDLRLKENVKPLKDRAGSRLGDLKRMRPISYRLKGQSHDRIGFSAQAVRDAVPELAANLQTDSRRGDEPRSIREEAMPDDPIGVSMMGLLGLAYEAINELSDKLDKVEAKQK